MHRGTVAVGASNDNPHSISIVDLGKCSELSNRCRALTTNVASRSDVGRSEPLQGYSRSESVVARRVQYVQ